MDTLDKPLLSDTVVARSATFVQGGTITGFGGHLARALQLTLLTGLVVGPAVTLYHFYGAVPMAPSPQSGGSCSSPIVAGHVNVNIDGKKTLMTLVSSQPSALTVSADSSTFVVPYGARAYLVTDPCPQQWTPDLFFDSPFVLTNRQFSARVSLAQISCGCAGTVYFASMPAYAEDGSLDPGPDGDYYCIADTLNGCPEMDILEANDMSLSVAPHVCVGNQVVGGKGGYYPLCDHDGCAVNTKESWPLPFYGPGTDFMINTQQPIDVTASFPAGPDGNLTRIDVALLQQGAGIIPAEYLIDINNKTCDWLTHPGYPQLMTYPFSRPMTPVFSVWGGTGQTFAWLDVPPCDKSVDCASGSASMTVSNLALRWNNVSSNAAAASGATQRRTQRHTTKANRS